MKELVIQHVGADSVSIVLAGHVRVISVPAAGRLADALRMNRTWTEWGITVEPVDDDMVHFDVGGPVSMFLTSDEAERVAAVLDARTRRTMSMWLETGSVSK